VGAGTLGVHAALRDHFAGEMGELFDQPDILQQGRTGGPAVWMLRLSVTGVPDAWQRRCLDGRSLDCPKAYVGPKGIYASLSQ